MRSLLILFTLLVIANKSIAQSDGALNDFNDDVKAAKRGEASIIPGNPYEKAASVPTIFYLKDKKVVEKATKLNYFHSNFEYIENEKTYLADAGTIDSVVFDRAAYVYKSFAIDGTKKLRVVKVIGQMGSKAVYFYKEVVFKPAVKAGGYIEPKPARYERGEEVYLFESDDNIVILDSFKGFTSLFPGKESDIKKFIKENGISKNKPEELKKLLQFVSQF